MWFYPQNRDGKIITACYNCIVNSTDVYSTEQILKGKITEKNGSATISFHNSNIQNGVPIAIILQYGHGTRNGGWVEGRDYINPAIRPVFEKIANDAWEEVTKL